MIPGKAALRFEWGSNAGLTKRELTVESSVLNMKYFSGLFIIAFLLNSWPAQADEAEDQYLHVISLADQADTLKTGGKAGPALAKYQEAQTALRTFQKNHPRWNMNVVSYRLNYLSENIAALSGNSSSAAAASAPSDSQVKLLEPGAEPRKVLRLHPKPGDKQTMVMNIKMGIDMKVGDVLNQAVKVPAMTITMDVTVKSVSPTGDISYETLMGDGTVAEDVEVMPQISEAMKASLAKMKGLSGTGTMSSRGISKGIEIKVPESADPQTRQAIEQTKESFSMIATPFPEEAVGVGARWEFKTKIKSQGMTIDQTAVYELLSIEDERLTAKNTITQSAAKQKIQNPAMPALKFDLDKMTGNGTGEITFDLSKVVAPEGTLNTHSELMMGMNAEGQKQAMTMKMDLNLRIEAK